MDIRHYDLHDVRLILSVKSFRLVQQLVDYFLERVMFPFEPISLFGLEVSQYSVGPEGIDHNFGGVWLLDLVV